MSDEFVNDRGDGGIQTQRSGTLVVYNIKPWFNEKALYHRLIQNPDQGRNVSCFIYNITVCT